MYIDLYQVIGMKLLSIQSSVRVESSISRRLSNEFVTTLKAHQTDIVIKTRDVGTQPPAHPTELWTSANYTEPKMRSPEMHAVLAESEALIEELLWADCLVLGVPMYNFSVPATLKAYIDNVVRINRTFSFDPETYAFQGLVSSKKAVVITPSAGDFTMSSEGATMNFCDTYLRSLLMFIGITDVYIVPVPNLFMGDEIKEQSIQAAKDELIELAAGW